MTRRVAFQLGAVCFTPDTKNITLALPVTGSYDSFEGKTMIRSLCNSVSTLLSATFLALALLPSAHAQSVANGKTLWETTCATGGGCHSITTPANARPVVKPRGETAAGIRNTINANTGGMGILRNLTDAQLADIAAYIAAPATVQSQTINFTQPADVRLGSGAVSLTATATSNLTVTFSSQTANICSVNGNSATLTAVGDCTIRASQAGNGSFSAATSLDRTFKVLAQAAVTPAANYTGWWSDPNEPGWGLGLEQYASTKVFGAIFFSGAPAAGEQNSPGTFNTLLNVNGWTTPTSFNADLASSRAPNFKVTPYNSSAFAGAAEGNATITFESTTKASIVLRFKEGVTITKQLTKLNIQ
jgi:cytochrome c553